MSTSTYDIIAEVLKNKGFSEVEGYTCFTHKDPDIQIYVTEPRADKLCQIRLELNDQKSMYPERVITFLVVGNSFIVQKIKGDKNPELNSFTLDMIDSLINNPHRVKYIPPERIIPGPRPAQELLKKIERKFKSCRLEIVPHFEGRYYDIVAKPTKDNEGQLEFSAVATEKIIKVRAYYEPDPSRSIIAEYCANFKRGKDGIFHPANTTFSDSDHRVKNPLAKKVIKYIQTAVFD